MLRSIHELFRFRPVEIKIECLQTPNQYYTWFEGAQL